MTCPEVIGHQDKVVYSTIGSAQDVIQLFTATEDDIKELFGQQGTVHSVVLINDRETGRPRGYGGCRW